MQTAEPNPALDRRFSDADAGATPWHETQIALSRAELYWITTIRAGGRPHVTPLIGVYEDGAMHFCTGVEEQKARNLDHHPHVALTTGNNTWARGLDVVVEGAAARVTDHSTLQQLADAYETKYGSDWHFDVVEGGFGHPGGGSLGAVFRIEPAKVMAFAKDPHAQTTYRFDG